MNVEFAVRSRALGLVVALVVGVGALGLGAYAHHGQSTALNSADPVNATIVSTSVEAADRGPFTDYRPTATFTYTYEGETYTSTKVYPWKLDREFDSRAEARAVVEPYDAGDTVTVYVPADSPGEAYLVRRRSDGPLVLMGFGGFVLLTRAVSVLRE